MKPRNLKQALEQGFVIREIGYKYNKKILVKLKRRFHKDDQVDFVRFWIDRKYFERTYGL